MSVRHSEYELLPGDCYYTPAWVTEALLRAEDFPLCLSDPAMGVGHMTEVFDERFGCDNVTGNDISNGVDFLTSNLIGGVRSIITNPPYSNGLAEKFVRHALDLTEPVQGKVAMLLPLAWDSAKSRSDLFKEHPAFKAKYTLTRRIRWENLEQKKNGPSQNHAWFVWDWNFGKHNYQEPHVKPKPLCGYLP